MTTTRACTRLSKRLCVCACVYLRLFAAAESDPPLPTHRYAPPLPHPPARPPAPQALQLLSGMAELLDAATNPRQLSKMEATWHPWF